MCVALPGHFPFGSERCRPGANHSESGCSAVGLPVPGFFHRIEMMTDNVDVVRQLLALLSPSPATTPSASADQYVIVRCTGAGVHAGELVSVDGQTVKLRNARRLWKWRVPMGAPSFLSGVATHGIDVDHSKVGTPVTITLLEACEVIEASDTARNLIQSAPEEERTR